MRTLDLNWSDFKIWGIRLVEMLWEYEGKFNL